MCCEVLAGYACGHIYTTGYQVCDVIAIDAMREAEKLDGRDLPLEAHDVWEELYEVDEICRGCRE